MNLETFVPQEDQLDSLVENRFNEAFAAQKGRMPVGNERSEWVQNEGGSEAIRGVAPVAFAAQVVPGTDLSDPQSFLRPTVQISPVVNPLFHALMIKLGATPNGVRSYEVSARKAKTVGEQAQIVKRLNAILKVLPGSVCYAQSSVEQGEKQGFHSLNSSRHMVFRDVYCAIRDTTAGEDVPRKVLEQIKHDHPTDSILSSMDINGEDVSGLSALKGAAIVITSGKGRIFIKVCTNRASSEGLTFSDEEGTPDFDRLRAGGRLDPQLVTPDRAVALMGEAKAQGYTILDPEGDLDRLGSALDTMTVAQSVPGAPGQSRLVVGKAVKANLGSAAKRLGAESDQVRTALVPCSDAGKAVKAALKSGATAVIDPLVADVIAMTVAAPAAADAPGSDLTLRDYQREAVGLHLATEVGYLQACSVGLGKTAITLRGMRGWAEKNAAK